jgi:hypothetical protein
MKKGSSGRNWKSGEENFSRKQTGNQLIEKKARLSLRNFRFVFSNTTELLARQGVSPVDV